MDKTRKSKDNWDEILNRKPILTKSEAEEMKKTVMKFREEYDLDRTSTPDPG